MVQKLPYKNILYIREMRGWSTTICTNVLTALKLENAEKVQSLLAYYWSYKPKGVEPGHLVRDEQGNVITRIGRVSRNDPWYQQAYKRFGHKPTKGNLYAFVLDELRNGRYNGLENIPPDEVFVQNEFVIELLENMLKGIPTRG